MLTIFEKISEKNANAVLCLVGPKEGLYWQINEKVKKQKLEKKVYFVGKQ